MRLFAADFYLTLKARTRALVKMAGGIESASSITRGCNQLFSRYGNVNHESFVALDQLADLMKDTGDIGVLQVLAQAMEHRLVPLACPKGQLTPAEAICLCGHSADLAAVTQQATCPTSPGGVEWTLEEAEDALVRLRRAEKLVGDAIDSLSNIQRAQKPIDEPNAGAAT